MNWNDTKQRIREFVLADIEHGYLHHQAHIRKTTSVIYPLGEFVMIPTLEFVPAGWDDDDRLYDYAHEFADSAEWVIYTAKARALWADSWEIAEYEDAYGYNDDGQNIDQQITSCVYLATRDAVMQVIQDIRDKEETLQHYCNHGVYIGDPWGPDFMCVYCELGEE